MIRRTVHYSGRVQGVGFRYTAHRIAGGFAVVGFVRNLPDGRVEMVAEGEPPEIDGLMAAIAEEMGSNIINVDQEQSGPTREFVSFDIRR